MVIRLHDMCVWKVVETPSLVSFSMAISRIKLVIVDRLINGVGELDDGTSPVPLDSRGNPTYLILDVRDSEAFAQCHIFGGLILMSQRY